MNWATRRRLLIMGGIGAVVVLIAAATVFAFIYRPPSCTDRKQNQDETGVDCGGTSCTYLCTAEVDAPVVRFVRPLSPAPGRTDVVAYIENRNQTAAVKHARYTIELYDADNLLIGKQGGVIDLPPRSIIPLFVPGFPTDRHDAVRAFLAFNVDSLHWTTETRAAVAPSVGDIRLDTSAQPRVYAIARNQAPRTLYDSMLVATVFDAAGTVIAASQTVLREIPGQGAVSALFTWNEPFTGVPVRVEVLPVPMLP